MHPYTVILSVLAAQAAQAASQSLTTPAAPEITPRAVVSGTFSRPGVGVVVVAAAAAATVQSPLHDAADATVQGPRIRKAATVQGPKQPQTASFGAATVQKRGPDATVQGPRQAPTAAALLGATVQGPKPTAAAAHADATVQSPRRRTAFAHVPVGRAAADPTSVPTPSWASRAEKAEATARGNGIPGVDVTVWPTAVAAWAVAAEC